MFLGLRIWITNLQKVDNPEQKKNFLNCCSKQTNKSDSCFVSDCITVMVKRKLIPTSLEAAAMRDAIHQKRRVELCFEGKRFYDIIRWKIADQVMNVDKHAMKITNTSPTNNSGVWKYEVIPLNHPHTFTMKMYLDPIPQPVMAQNPNLVQNPGY